MITSKPYVIVQDPAIAEFLLVTLLAFRSVVAATSRLANDKQLLSELIIPQAPTTPDMPVISLRFPPPPFLHLAHSGHQVGRRCFDDKMEVIVHQAISMHLQTCFLASFAQRGNKPQAVGVIAKNVLPLVSTTHNLVNRTRIFDS